MYKNININLKCSVILLAYIRIFKIEYTYLHFKLIISIESSVNILSLFVKFKKSIACDHKRILNIKCIFFTQTKSNL